MYLLMKNVQNATARLFSQQPGLAKKWKNALLENGTAQQRKSLDAILSSGSMEQLSRLMKTVQNAEPNSSFSQQTMAKKWKNALLPIGIPKTEKQQDARMSIGLNRNIQRMKPMIQEVKSSFLQSLKRNLTNPRYDKDEDNSRDS